MAAPVKSVIVVGAGIGGLTVANALMRKGLTVQVLERAKKFESSAGAGFGFSPNGQACLESIGISLEQQEKITHPLLDHVILSGNSILSRSDHLTRIRDKYGMTLAGTLRADLVDLLMKPLKQEGVLHHGITVNEVTQSSSDKAQVTLSTGEVKEADLVIGADGINSTVAKHVSGGKPDAPVYSGESIYYGVVEDGYDNPNPISFIGKPNTLVQLFDRGEFITFPVGGPSTRILVWALTHNVEKPPKRNEWGQAGSTRKEFESLVLGKYGPDFPALELAKQTADDRLLHFGLWFRRHKPKWHKGRVVLLGDACHATLPYVGQGANQAIEDGIVLTQCLAEPSGFRDVEEGLKAYLKARHTRTKRVVDMAWYLGKIMHVENPVAAWGRDRLLKYLVDSGELMKKVDREILENCPVPIGKAGKGAKGPNFA